MRGKLRKAKLESGKYSLYIDYYPPVWNPHINKYTRREFLRLYLYQNPQTTLQRQENALANEIAQKIYIKRMKSLLLDAHGIFNKDILEGDFYAYYEKFIKKKQKDDIETAVYYSALQHLKSWRPENIKFKHIDELFLEGFKNYLQTATFLRSEINSLKPNSQANYFDKVASVVSQAFVDRYLPEDYTLRVKRIQNEASLSEKLEMDDFDILNATPCEDELVYQSSIFAYLSGFRFSAVKAFKWKHLQYSKPLECWYVELIDPKPSRPFKNFICKEAVDILGERGSDDEYVFQNMSYYRIHRGLKKWFEMAGLESKARFHNWRRRYASDLKYNDVDIYVIKNMLNHKHISTTEIYTDVEDLKMAHAANKLTTHKK
jgi:site-specific recombinase XerD